MKNLKKNGWKGNFELSYSLVKKIDKRKFRCTSKSRMKKIFIEQNKVT
jgi:hypothetical protein